MEFLSPYDQAKLLSGVIPGNKIKRPNMLQKSFGRMETTIRDTVNFDKEYNTKNVMGMFVAPQVDASRVQLGNYGTFELNFSYTKEAIGSPDYSEISQRQIGQQFGTEQDVMSNYAMNIRKQTAYALERIENLHELVARDVLYYGGYTAVSEKHPKVVYDFGRTVYDVTGTTQGVRDANHAALNNDLIPEVDLTTLKANTSTDVAGGRSWDSISGVSGSAVTPVAAIDPVADLQRMVEIARYRAGVSEIHMSPDAYKWFRAALLSAAYQDMWDRTKNVSSTITMDIVQKLQEIEGVTLMMMWTPDDGMTYIPIYVNKATYHDRTTGVKTNYCPDGYVLLIPPAQYGIKVFGRIMHPKAGWRPQELWINYWMNDKTGIEEWELHQNFIIGHTDIDSVVCWKVCSTSP